MKGYPWTVPHGEEFEVETSRDDGTFFVSMPSRLADEPWPDYLQRTVQLLEKTASERAMAMVGFPFSGGMRSRLQCILLVQAKLLIQEILELSKADHEETAARVQQLLASR